MKKVVKGLLVSLVGFGTLGGTLVPASASETYSASRANSVRLVWRDSMGHYDYHNGAAGARYSEHLGIRYQDNAATEHVTWITDAHEKLYNPQTHTDAIYYHVHNQAYTMGGWIWRGYLTAGPAKATTKQAAAKQPALTNWADAYRGTFEVRIEKPTELTKLAFGEYSYQNHSIGTTTLKKGTIIDVTYTGHDGIVWRVSSKDYPTTSSYTYTANFTQGAFKEIRQIK